MNQAILREGLSKSCLKSRSWSKSRWRSLCGSKCGRWRESMSRTQSGRWYHSWSWSGSTVWFWSKSMSNSGFWDGSISRKNSNFFVEENKTDIPSPGWFWNNFYKQSRSRSRRSRKNILM